MSSQQIDEIYREIRMLNIRIQERVEAPTFECQFHGDQFDGICNKIGKLIGLTSGGGVSKSYPLKRLIKYDPENIDKYFFNYNYNEQADHARNKEGDGWVEFDFKLFKAEIFSYVIRSTPYEANKYHHPKSWKIVGSNDRNEWTEIDHQVNVDQLNGPSRQVIFHCHNNNNNGHANKFRYIRYVQEDAWCDGKTVTPNKYCIHIACFEFFGNLYK